MSTALAIAPAKDRPLQGGAPARRAVTRWAWRMFLRQWRQQLLVVLLLLVAVAGTTAGLGVITNLTQSVAARFGTANTSISLNATGAQLAVDLNRAHQVFGTVEEIQHQQVRVAGTVNTVDLRAQDPHGPFGSPMLRLRSGRWPGSRDEVAVTPGVARMFQLSLGATWTANGHPLHVVGLVENPLDLQDEFGLMAPGALAAPDSVQLLANTARSSLESFRVGGDVSIDTVGQDAATQKRIQDVSVLLLGTIGLLFVGLLAVAGFTVLAQRRQRALGMLAAIGASDRHLRLVMVANGAIVGAVGAGLGALLGVLGWLAFAPAFEGIAEHRINRFDLPWWAVGVEIVLAVVTAIAASWWPARAAARVSIVSALSGRPTPPRPAHRFAAAGLVLAAAGYALLVEAEQRRSVLIVSGILATSFGMLLLAPLGLSLLAAPAARAPVAVRLALRDLSRYRARAGAAVAAIALAVGIAATIAVSAAAQVATQTPATGNLTANELTVRLTDQQEPVVELTDAQLTTLRALAATIATSVNGGAPLELDSAENPTATPPTQVGAGAKPVSGTAHPGAMVVQPVARAHGFDFIGIVGPYVATPAVLGSFGIASSAVNPSSDILTSRKDLSGMALLSGTRQPLQHPVIQVIASLPGHSSEPTTLITEHAMQELGLKATPVAFLIRAPHALTAAQISGAVHRAAAVGMIIETRTDPVRSLSKLRDWSTGIGILAALGVLAMTVGLIRSETAGDLRTLAATGASASIRRTLTATTAAALGLLGGFIGTGTAYLALLAWNHKHPGPLEHVPILNLVALLVGLPVLAAVGAWLVGGRQSTTLARPALD